MTLAEFLATPLPDTATLQTLAIVFDTALAQRLAEVQGEHGDPRHVPNALLLTDGRYMLTGDILIACQPGGVVHGGFSHLDASRFDEIDVIALADAVALLPESPSPVS
jgi:hypothetical protein